jgi:hypothetical protein
MLSVEIVVPMSANKFLDTGTDASATVWGDHTYFNYIGKLPIGMVYEGYTGPAGDVAVGDMVLFDDTDASEHDDSCNLIVSRSFIGYVTHICAFENGSSRLPEVNLLTSMPIGRVKLGDDNVEVIETDGDPSEFGQPKIEKENTRIGSLAAEFKRSTYQDWMMNERHYGSSILTEEQKQEFSICDKCVETEVGWTDIDGD